jgi:Zn-dependent M28 family amino/carboxypeptidase
MNIYILILTLIFSSCSKEKKSLEEIKSQIKVNDTKNIISILSSDSLKGRDNKNRGYFKAADYVIKYFKKNNINPLYNGFKDIFYSDSIESYNIVGTVGEFLNERKTILIGAHLDHIGVIGVGPDSIYNGANDNASGCVSVLQIGSFLSQFEWDYNIILALFAEEENGLRGSYNLANRMKKESINLEYVINFEMIGKEMNIGTNKVYLTGYKISNLAQEINRVVPGFVTFFSKSAEFNLFQRSDNYPFYKAFDIPSQTLSSFDFENYKYYHHFDDEVNNLNIENLNEIIVSSAFFISNFLNQKTQITLNTR